MSIRQLDACCWELSNPGGEDDRQHFDSNARADAEVADLRKENPQSRASVALLPSRCWVVQCDGDCGQVIDEFDEGYICHHLTAAEAEKTARAWEWVLVPGPLGESVYCPEDRPEGAELPPPSPAEQEAAGQIPLPGVPSP